MDEQTYKRLAIMAKTFYELESESQNYNRADFWHGFRRGLTKLYFGDNFGNPGEHEKWLNCRDGEYRRELQTGYRAGFYRDELKIDGHEDVQTFRKMLGLSVSDLAEIASVSPRTVEGWEQGRAISEPARQLILKYLMI